MNEHILLWIIFLIFFLQNLFNVQLIFLLFLQYIFLLISLVYKFLLLFLIILFIIALRSILLIRVHQFLLISSLSLLFTTIDRNTIRLLSLLHDLFFLFNHFLLGLLFVRLNLKGQQLIIIGFLLELELEHILSQLMGIEHAFLLLFYFVSELNVIIHDPHLILLILLDKLLLSFYINQDILLLPVAFLEFIQECLRFNLFISIYYNYFFQLGLGMINLRSLFRLTHLLPLTQRYTLQPLLFQTHFSFAFMQLFEKNKRPDELDVAFKRQTKLKGHLKSKGIKSFSNKLNTKVKQQKQRLKNHKGLLKRIKIVGPRWNRRFKFLSPGKRHLNRKKTSANLIRKRRTRYVHKNDLFKVKKLIPYYKRKSLKQRY